MNYSALWSLLSLELTSRFVAAGQVAYTLAVTAASTTTPVVLTLPSHGIPPARVAHAIVSGIGGMPETTGTWELTPTDGDHCSLTAFDPQGNVTQCVGVGTYTSGGQVRIAFPDYQILVGLQMLALASAPASPRIVVVPTIGKAWDFSADGGPGFVGELPPVRGTAEQQAIDLTPQIATRYATWKVYITGCANPPQPNFGDFDATELIVESFYSVLFDMVSAPRALVLRESWPSQEKDSGVNLQRGQMWMGILQFERGVRDLPLQYIPHGTSLTFDIGAPPGGADDTRFTVT